MGVLVGRVAICTRSARGAGAEGAALVAAHGTVNDPARSAAQGTSERRPS